MITTIRTLTDSDGPTQYTVTGPNGRCLVTRTTDSEHFRTHRPGSSTALGWHDGRSSALREAARHAGAPDPDQLVADFDTTNPPTTYDLFGARRLSPAGLGATLRDVAVLPAVRHCETCGAELTQAEPQPGFPIDWEHTNGGCDDAVILPRPMCTYCHTDDPTHCGPIAPGRYAAACTRCGALAGIPLDI
jgi:hypothetical protein